MKLNMIGLLKQLLGGSPKNTPPRPRSASRVNAIIGHRPDTSGQKSVAEKLDNPELSLDIPKDDGFDPYNTGTFNRSGSWERINKRRNG